ncbi:MAG TPA: 3-oxoacyl-ACP reductase FabG [Anaeromyxobacteraceae bacterium]|nr:3-oxoacyl-ACP reductase FabG [Anaeromyxobacteraceae bacterium]
MEISLKGKRTLVTGANSGIGASIAAGIGAAGGRVFVNYIASPEAAEAVAAQIRKVGGEATPIEADVSDAGQVSAMFAQIDHAWGGIDILVNNAGIDGPRAPSWEIDPEAWERVVRIDLVGAFLCAREALRRMVAQRSGVILNLTSVHEKIAWSGYSAYTAAKAGLSMLTKTLAQEAAPHGVRVLALAPGAIRTSINRSVWSDPASLADLLTKIPLGRMGEPAEIARVATFLLSDGASYLTGSTVYVDGAMTDYPDFAHGG